MHSLAAGLVAAALATLAANAGAATFTVNSTADTTDGVCGASIGGCTLHEAIEAAVATPGRDTIAFDPSVFPLGAPATILLFQPMPVIADAAGTVLDGAGAGVVVEASKLAPPNPLVFASAAGQPLAKVMVANITVRNFSGSGIVICGGEFPVCDDDLSAVLVQNVVASGNGEDGVEILGHTISKVQVDGSVASGNLGEGIECRASSTVSGTRITGCTVRDNESAGIDVNATIEAAGTVIADSIAVHNGAYGIGVSAEEHITKTKLSNVAAVRNASDGIIVQGLGDVTTVTIANAAASSNMRFGIEVEGDGIAGVTLKDVVADGNIRGIAMGGLNQITGAKITNAKATGNQDGGIILTPEGGLVGAKISRVFVVGNNGFGLHFNGSNNVVQQVHASGNDGEAVIQLDAPGGGNTIEKCSSSTNNTMTTIAVQNGSTRNVIQKNVSLGNDGADLTDENAGCDGNTWKQNVFLFANDPCIH